MLMEKLSATSDFRLSFVCVHKIILPSFSLSLFNVIRYLIIKWWKSLENMISTVLEYTKCSSSAKTCHLALPLSLTLCAKRHKIRIIKIKVCLYVCKLWTFTGRNEFPFMLLLWQNKRLLVTCRTNRKKNHAQKLFSRGCGKTCVESCSTTIFSLPLQSHLENASSYGWVSCWFLLLFLWRSEEFYKPKRMIKWLFFCETLNRTRNIYQSSKAFSVRDFRTIVIGAHQSGIDDGKLRW